MTAIKDNLSEAFAGNRQQNIRTGLAADAIAEALIDNLHYLQAKLPKHATRNDWYMALAYTVRDRMLDRYIKTVEAIARADIRGQGCCLSLGGIFDWTASRQQPDQSRYLACDRKGSRPSRPESWRASRAGRRAGFGQRRPRPLGCLLHGFAGDAQRSGDRLRHPLRVRHLRPSDSRRLASGTDRQVAALRQPLGDRAFGIAFEVESGGCTESYCDEQGRYRVRWIPEKVVKGVAYDTSVPGYQVPTTTCCDCGRRKPPNRSISKHSTSVITMARWTKRSYRKLSPRFSIPMTSPKRASDCALRSSIFSSPARCRTWSVCT